MITTPAEHDFWWTALFILPVTAVLCSVIIAYGISRIGRRQ